jgi:alpha-glucosidase
VARDTTRLRTLVGGSRDQARVAAGMLFTMPGIPLVTYGDEIGMPGDFGEAGRRPMPWSARGTDPDQWDEELHDTYRTLVRTRRASPALASGGLRWLHTEDDALVFLREHPEETVLVHLARAAHDPVSLPAYFLPGIGDGCALVGPPPRFDGGPAGDVRLTADEPVVRIWSWRPPVPAWAVSSVLEEVAP